jgi:hypothetical protein
MSSRNARRVLWFAGYLLTMAAVVAGMYWARQAVVTGFGSPEALAEWRQWKAETERLRKEGGPVQRRAVTSDEPPALVLMRDSFSAILAGSIAIGSFLFAFLAFIIEGSMRKPTDVNRESAPRRVK